MIERETGGPAFPTVDANRAFDYGSVGMTLRDYFAGKAMQGYSGAFNLESATPEKIAGWAYEQADAMLQERAK